MQAVDPVALGLGDYLEIVKHPMDLSTIKVRPEVKLLSSPHIQYITLFVPDIIPMYSSTNARVA